MPTNNPDDNAPKFPTDEDLVREIEWYDRSPHKPRQVIDALLYVHDTMKLARLSAEILFKDRATPDVAMALYDRINAERLRRVAEQERPREEAHRDELVPLIRRTDGTPMAQALRLHCRSTVATRHLRPRRPERA